MTHKRARQELRSLQSVLAGEAAWPPWLMRTDACVRRFVGLLDPPRRACAGVDRGREPAPREQQRFRRQHCPVVAAPEPRRPHPPRVHPATASPFRLSRRPHARHAPGMAAPVRFPATRRHDHSRRKLQPADCRPAPRTVEARCREQTAGRPCASPMACPGRRCANGCKSNGYPTRKSAKAAPGAPPATAICSADARRGSRPRADSPRKWPVRRAAGGTLEIYEGRPHIQR